MFLSWNERSTIKTRKTDMILDSKLANINQYIQSVIDFANVENKRINFSSLRYLTLVLLPTEIKRF